MAPSLDDHFPLHQQPLDGMWGARQDANQYEHLKSEMYNLCSSTN